jgi:UDP-N-acetyl-2-amino-2-deoxyglucuronate dehydrogenase
MEAEDAATVSLRFANGALGSIVATTSAEVEAPPELRVIGDRGQVRIVGGEPAVWEVPGHPRPADDASDAAAAAGSAGATWGTTSTGYLRQYTDFIAAVRTHGPPFVTGRDGRDALEIVTAAYESSRTGRAVAIRPDSQGVAT